METITQLLMEPHKYSRTVILQRLLIKKKYN
jgi:hypothetical protein